MAEVSSARAQAGVGRLGIITRLKLPVVPQAVVKRSLDITSIDEFARQLTEVQKDYIAAKAAGTAKAVEQTFLAISEVQVWLPPRVTCCSCKYVPAGGCCAQWSLHITSLESHCNKCQPVEGMCPCGR